MIFGHFIRHGGEKLRILQFGTAKWSCCSEMLLHTGRQGEQQASCTPACAPPEALGGDEEIKCEVATFKDAPNTTLCLRKESSHTRSDTSQHESLLLKNRQDVQFNMFTCSTLAPN